jgi:hypothetical protein
MKPLLRKSKMISIRLSPDEYRTFQNACAEKNVRSISDLARTAIQQLIGSNGQAERVSDPVRDLRDQVQVISVELDRLSKLVEKGPQ